MRRLLLVFGMMVALVAVVGIMSGTAFAAKGGNGGGATQGPTPCGIYDQEGNLQIVDGHVVVTPSGNANLQCHLKP